MNSFSAMQRAIDFEISRQVRRVCMHYFVSTPPVIGEQRDPFLQTKALREQKYADVISESRLWDENRRRTYGMRQKEGLADYRYFPEPDLLPLNLPASYVESVQVGRAALSCQMQRTSPQDHSQAPPRYDHRNSCLSCLLHGELDTNL